MLISGTVVIMVMGGALTLVVAAAVLLTVMDNRFDSGRRHWRPAESSTH